jgi:hypothetical protein
MIAPYVSAFGAPNAVFDIALMLELVDGKPHGKQEGAEQEWYEQPQRPFEFLHKVDGFFNGDAKCAYGHDHPSGSLSLERKKLLAFMVGEGLKYGDPPLLALPTIVK